MVVLGNIKGGNNFIKKLLECIPFGAMVTMEGCTIILTIWAKTVITNGMSPFVFVVSDEEPIFNLNFFLRIFLLGLTGTTKVDWRSRSFQTKVCGTIVPLVGATMVELYKGPLIKNSSSSLHLPMLSAAKKFLIFSTNNPQYWLLGGLLLAAASLCVAFWNTLQAGTVKQYPQVMKVASFYSTIGTLQSALLSALIFETDLNAWKLNLNSTELLLIVLTASFMGIIRSCVHQWCMRMKGPLYVPMFKPFGVVFATIFGTSLPATTLCYGSVIGTAIVGMGYFTVMWGQLNHEDEVSTNSNNTKQYDVESPPQEHNDVDDDVDDDDENYNVKTPLLKPQQNYVQ
ncbi:hypothetical protein CsatA_015255 [Cannabis sativa]